MTENENNEENNSIREEWDNMSIKEKCLFNGYEDFKQKYYERKRWRVLNEQK